MLTIGIDSHTTLLVGVALNGSGHALGSWSGGNRPSDWTAVRDWARELEATDRIWGIEGSGGYGKGLAQQLITAGEVVYEVNPRLTAAERQHARRRDKSDQDDATAIAKLVQREHDTLPRVQADDTTSILAGLTAERQAAQATATRLRNQLHQLIHQLDPGGNHATLTKPEIVAELIDYAAPSDDALSQARAGSVRRLAAQLQLVMEQITDVGKQIERLARVDYAPLTELVGISALTAGMLAGYLGPGDRFASDAQLAAYAGVAPLATGSAGVVRYRLNRGGQRQLNAILRRIAMTQETHSDDAKAYLARRQQEGKSWREAVRALERFICRAIWHAWRRCLTRDAAPALT